MDSTRQGAWIGLSKRYCLHFKNHWIRHIVNFESTKQDDPVTEQTPYQFHYHRTWLVLEGRPNEVAVALYYDRTSRAPVLYADKNVKELVRLKADISTVPKQSFRKEEGKDGNTYYDFSFSIDVTYQSAPTKYGLIHNGMWPPAKMPRLFYLTSN
jgi:hypothetical protein